ncbi:hypothetical protein GALMADRAFT_242596 [Galerina marginata CBS 339.88]|uniref:Uncharacterized protein n=1 Tax=Galerina marginata (strain CBS 339.88) TaxID=685588 RepID=A0A067TD31_GALM3|nr:hypothetical protein GALMADRAFT_242596 [Galerina marginata CBS 339.88]
MEIPDAQVPKRNCREFRVLPSVAPSFSLKKSKGRHRASTYSVCPVLLTEPPTTHAKMSAS